MERLLLKVVEAAALAAVSKSQAYVYVRSGEWPSVRVGSHIRVVYAGLVEWIERQTDLWKVAPLIDGEDEAGNRVIQRR